MRIALALAALVVMAAPAAAAQCVSIGDSSGGAAIHCWDGRIGHLQSQPGGAVTGMLGGQVIMGAREQVVPGVGSDQPLSGYVNPDIAMRTAPVPPPPLAPPSPLAEPSLSPPTIPAYPEAEQAGSQRPREP